MALLTWRAENGGKWIFTAIAAIFLILFAAWIVGLGRSKAAHETTNTVFVPHRLIALAILLLLLVAVAAVISIIRG